MSVRVSVMHWLLDERFNGLISFLQKHREAVDEIAFFSSAIHPVLPLDIIEERAAIMGKRMASARKEGYRAGINFLSTLGHLDEYMENALKGDFIRMTGIDGSQAEGSFCPNDENYRAFLIKVYSALAKAKPDFIWIDDDIRISNHSPAQNPCFCENCLSIFNKANGSSHTRESLQTAFDEGSAEKKMDTRQAWMLHNACSIKRLLSLLEESVHKINPGIELGLMTGERFYEGYDFQEWAQSLSGTNGVKVKWRPGGGFYSDELMRGIIEKSHQIGRQISLLPGHVVNIQSEIENFPYQPLRKSVKTTVLESASYIAAGCTGSAYNVLGMFAEPLDEYEHLFKQLADSRAFFDLLAQEFGRSRPEGIFTAWKKLSLASNNPEGKWFKGGNFYKDISEPLDICELGLPPAYSMAGAHANLLSGNLSMSFRREELKSILSGGVYMDGKTLERLNEMGLSKLTGFTVDKWEEKDCAEILTDDPLNGEAVGWRRDCIQSFWKNPCASLSPLDSSARVIGRKIERLGTEQTFPCMGAYENQLGGRVVVAGYAPWTFLQSHAKSVQMKRLFRWLSRDSIPGYVESYHKANIWVRKRLNGGLAVALINSSQDPARDLKILIRSSSKELSLVDMKCKIKNIRQSGHDGPYTRFKLPCIAPWSMVFLLS